MKARSLRPYATLATENNSDGSDGPDLNNSAFLELGIAPEFSFDVHTTPIKLTLPKLVGLSLSGYYQDAVGADDTFGFGQVGAKAYIPFGEPGRFGAWTPDAGSQSCSWATTPSTSTVVPARR